jgi:ankyrin repeat protein
MQRRTPLADAATLSNPTPLQVLLSHGARIDPEALFHAIGIRRQANGTSTLTLLIEHGADVNYVSERWCTPLYQCVRLNQEAKLRLLLEHGADPNVRSLNNGITALNYAKERGRMNLYDLMKENYSQMAP